MNIGEYILIKDKYVGKIVKLLWNNTNLIVKLENYTDYIDPTIKNNNLLDSVSNNEGYMLVPLNNNIKKLNQELLEQSIEKYNESFEKISVKVQINFNNYIDKIKRMYPQNFVDNIDNINNISSDSQINRHKKNPLDIPKSKLRRYQNQDKKEDDYQKYILTMIENLFKEKEVVYEEEFLNAKPENYVTSIEYLGENDINNVVKPILIQILEKYYSINEEEYYDFKNTLMYKHIILSNDMDTLSLGKQFINKIKDQLFKLQNKLKLDNGVVDGSEFTDKTNLFDFIKFRIVGDYIELVNKNYDENNRKITRDLIPNLVSLEDEYGKSIDHLKLINMILESKTPEDILVNQEKIKEAIKILSQEYYICIQPKVELLLWTICRLIICWYSDKNLYERIYKVKILINLYRSRGLKEFNQDYDVLPIITVIPKYGKIDAIKVGSHLNYYFFVYRRLGNEESNPTYFNKLDDLMYYTNGSLDIKKHVKFILNKKKETAVLVNEYNNKIATATEIVDTDIQKVYNVKIEK